MYRLLPAFGSMLFIKSVAIIGGTLCFMAESAAVLAQTVAGSEVMPEVLNLTGASLHVGVTIWMINRVDRLIKDVVGQFQEREEKSIEAAAIRDDRREKANAELSREMIGALRESTRAMGVLSSKVPFPEK